MHPSVGEPNMEHIARNVYCGARLRDPTLQWSPASLRADGIWLNHVSEMRGR